MSILYQCDICGQSPKDILSTVCITSSSKIFKKKCKNDDQENYDKEKNNPSLYLAFPSMEPSYHIKKKYEVCEKCFSMFGGLLEESKNRYKIDKEEFSKMFK